MFDRGSLFSLTLHKKSLLTTFFGNLYFYQGLFRTFELPYCPLLSV